jgi:hypothetical protein
MYSQSGNLGIASGAGKDLSVASRDDAAPLALKRLHDD